jgi:G:T-mismatch repair DNA endonuclease (very short patch repair protein)
LAFGSIVKPKFDTPISLARQKIPANKTRDRLVAQTLRRAGWHVIRIWECALQKRPESCIERIRKCLNPEN